jgi:hypothetical protein
VTVAKEKKESRLRQVSAIAESGVKLLRQKDRTWEADFLALPKPMAQSETHYLGIVVSEDGGAAPANRRSRVGPPPATSPPCSPRP